MKGKVKIDPEVLLAESQSSWFSFFLAIIWAQIRPSELWALDSRSFVGRKPQMEIFYWILMEVPPIQFPKRRKRQVLHTQIPPV